VGFHLSLPTYPKILGRQEEIQDGAEEEGE
jgi:hypothetical protein